MGTGYDTDASALSKNDNYVYYNFSKLGASDNKIFNKFKTVDSIKRECSYEITNQAYFDDLENKYLLDEKPVQKSEVEEYFENWNKNTTKVSWKDIN